MDHKVKTFVFVSKTGSEVKLTSRKFCFKLDEVIKSRFGEDILNEYLSSGDLNYDITIDEVKEDFPKLLEGEGLESIDWSDQEIDDLLGVYLFFIRYKQNALLRLLKQEEQTLASHLGILTKTMSSMPPGILKRIS